MSKKVVLLAVSMISTGCAYRGPIVDDGKPGLSRAERLDDRDFHRCIELHKMFAPLVCN